MRKIIKLNKSYLLLKFKDKNRYDFYELLDEIKKIPGRAFHPTIKGWVIPNTNENIKRLLELGFKFGDIVGKIMFTITNNLLQIETNLDNLVKLESEFTFNDYSYCFVGGIFDKNRVFKRKMLKIKNGIGLLSIGFLKDLLNYLKENNIDYTWIDRREVLSNFHSYTDEEIKNNLHYLTLYDYQIETVKTCIEEVNCIIKLPTSSGKTEIFLSICNLLKIKTLILFSRIDLARQTLRRSKKANLDSGIVQGQEVDEDHQIIMCTVQSAHKLKEKYQMVIVDECHRARGKQYDKILKRKDFLFRFGFSATPFVKDQYKKAKVKKWLGNIAYELPAEKLVNEGKIAKPIINIIHIVNPPLSNDYSWQDAEWCGIVENDYRNNKITELCNELDNILVLVKKIQHGKILERKIPNAIFLSGCSEVIDRIKYVQKFEDGENIILIASTIFDEGISIKSIRNLIIAGGGKSYIKTIQRIGRGLRIKDNKSTVNVYDFLDDIHKILSRHSLERIKNYEKEFNLEVNYV